MTFEHPLRLALEVDGGGAHPGAWSPEVLGPRALRDVVSRAEAGGFTLVTYEDAPLAPGTSRLEAVGRAAYAAASTDRVGPAPRRGDANP